MTAQALDGMEAMPAVQEHAIAAATSEENIKSENIEAVAGGRTDTNGKTFDPAIHETESDGTPRLSPTGKLRLKRGRGAPSFNHSQPLNGVTPKQTTSDGPSSTSANVLPQAPKATPQEIELAAKSTMNLIFIGSSIVFGVEDGKLTDDELKRGVTTFSQYYEARGIIKIPPEVAVIGFLATIGVSRWSRPKFVERRKTFREKFILWYLRMRGGKRVEPDAPPSVSEQLEARTVEPSIN